MILGAASSVNAFDAHNVSWAVELASCLYQLHCSLLQNADLSVARPSIKQHIGMR